MGKYSKYDTTEYYYAAMLHNEQQNDSQTNDNDKPRPLKSSWPELATKKPETKEFWRVDHEGNTVFTSKEKLLCERFLMVNEGIIIQVSLTPEDEHAQKEEANQRFWEDNLWK